ncbi:MAG: DUF881 domain-containing protein [Tetrasphaera sp.]
MAHAHGPPGRLALLTSTPTMWSALVPLIALLAGVLFAASNQAARGTNLRAEAAGVPDLIRQRSLANLQAGAQVERLRTEVEELTRRDAPVDASLRAATAAVDRLAIVAGETPVRGPAVAVSLDDSPLTSDQLPDWANVNDIVVHQQDVQAVVNALWRGGADALMVMDQRIISTSAVRCVGNTLILQGRVYAPPFTITAIGDPDDLVAALDADPQIRTYKQYVAELGLGYSVQRRAEVTLPGFVGGAPLTSARVLR